MEANTPEWCTAKLKTPRVSGQQWYQSQRKKRAATTGHFRNKGFGVSAGVRIGNRLFKGNRVQGEIKRGDSKPSEGRREIIQGFARLRLGNGRRPRNRAVTGGSKQGKMQKSREIVNKALGNEFDLNTLTHESLDKLSQSLDQEMVIQTKGNKLNSYLDRHYESLFNEMMNFKEFEKGEVYECIKVDSLSSMFEFLNSLENEELVIKHKEVFKFGFDNMLKWFYTKQLGLEKVLDIPPKLDGYEIELMHFCLIVKYMGGYGIVTREGKWLDVIEKMGLLVYMESMVELCYVKYFSLMDCYYKTMLEENVGTSKIKKESVICEKGHYGNSENYEDNEKKVWVKRKVSAYRDWPYLCGPIDTIEGQTCDGIGCSNGFSEEFESCEEEVFSDHLKRAAEEAAETGFEWAVKKATSAEPITVAAEMGSSKSIVAVLKPAVAVSKPAVAGLNAEFDMTKVAVEQDVADAKSSSEDDDLIIISKEDVKDW
ncbi:hypothetical protein E3N88_23103 [Mikania micrantha]|uniref:ARID domain-containing protein n=1 Tax=Mikania micrantha TaxID=192012 RepID=A0A5N6NCD1_9ASTR|nr:hypothetical protein E3N88_23103 [Mikania micrantha]